MVRNLSASILLLAVSVVPVEAAHLGMGLRVGEVTQASAVVWARITATAERNHDGFRSPLKRSPRQNKYVPSDVPVAKRQGEISGAPGEMQLTLTLKGFISLASTSIIE